MSHAGLASLFPALCRVAAAGTVAFGFVAAAAAQNYPSKPIRMINPWPPGGAADATIRVVTDKLSVVIGQPVVVESHSGANATIGTALVARAPADGYTLLFSHIGPMAISPHMMTLPYDPVKDFAPITQLTSSAMAMIVRSDVPVKNVSEFLAYARANPGKLNLGSIGLGSTPHLAGEMMRSLTGIRYVHVPYKGSAQVLTDMAGGQIEFSFLNLGGAMPFIQNGKVRVIGMSYAKRSPLTPEIPAVAESLPGYEVNTWYGLEAPAGTPRPIIDKLYAEVSKVLKMKDVAEKLNQMSYDVEGTTPEQHGAKLREDIVKWGAVIKAAGVAKQ